MLSVKLVVWQTVRSHMHIILPEWRYIPEWIYISNPIPKQRPTLALYTHMVPEERYGVLRIFE